MIQKRSLNILKIIINNPDITYEEIELKTNLSKRQIDYTIENINHWLVTNDYSEIEKSFGGKLHLEKNIKAIINDLLKGKVDYIFDELERQKIIFFYLYLNYEEVSLYHLIDILKVSRGTINDDLKKLNNQLVSKNISIKYTREKGYEIVGAELDIFHSMMLYLVEIISFEEVLYIIQVVLRDTDLSFLKTFKQTVKKNLKHSELFISDNNLNIICYIYLFYHIRGNKIDLQNENKIATDFDNNIEYKIAKETLKSLEMFDLQDVTILTSLILCYSTKRSNGQTDEDLMIDSLILSVLERLTKSYAMVLKDKQLIFEQLRAHIRPAIYRMYFNFPMVNPLKEEIILKYGPIFTIIEELFQISNYEVLNSISDDDLAYLTIHFATFISDTESVRDSQFTGAIVCPSGVGISVLLRNELVKLFPEINFVESLSIGELDNIVDQVDVVFSTVLVETDKTLFLVNPVMSNIEKVNLVKNFNKRFSHYSSKETLSVKSLINIVKKYADNLDEEGLSKEFSYLLSQKNHIGIRGEQPLLSEITSPELIQLNVEANDWQDAITKSAKVMVEKGKITEAYIEAMIRNTKENGPYIVITEHVALPHARPEEGALETAIGIATLETPVVFGHELNDPVKYIFCLSTKDNNSHLKALAELVELLDGDEFYNVLNNAKESTEILEYIVKKEQD